MKVLYPYFYYLTSEKPKSMPIFQESSPHYFAALFRGGRCHSCGELRAAQKDLYFIGLLTLLLYVFS
jgi:hypothetical protein